MEEEKQEITLEKHNVKSWFKAALLGVFIGLAVIVPGISGSTIAIIFKLYDKLLHAVSNIFKKFFICVLFLLPIVIGAGVGFVLGFLTIQQLLDILPFAIIGLFAGLMVGAFPAVNDEIKGTKKNTLRIILLIVGVIIPITIGVLSALLKDTSTITSEEAALNKFSSIKWWEYLIFLPIGYVVAITQVVPGLSATAVLMSLGYFKPLMGTFHASFWSEHPEIFGVYASLGIGFLVGLFTFSKCLTYLFKKARTSTYYLIVGLSLGSICSMFFNPDTYDVYLQWSKGEGKMALDLSLGLVFMAIGMVASYLLVRYERKKNAANIEATNED